MTTIAFKDGILAADGRATVGNRIVSDACRKIHRVEKQDLMIEGEKVLAFALAGTVSSTLVLKRILASEEGLLAGTGVDTDDSFSAIVVTPTTVYMASKGEESPNIDVWDWYDQPASIGSGSAIASHFLTTGATAIEAVEEAIKTDTGSGGELQIVNIKTLREKTK